MPKLEGVLERVTYYNDATFFMVARLRACDETLHTIIGNLPRFSVGEQLLLDGEWSEHPEYGRQFKATAYESAAPQNVKGILRFLSSGQVKGVGPATAEKIVHAFGAQALDVLEKEPARLTALEGIGEKRATMIAASLRERREIMRVMSFLQGFGVGPGYAARIYRKYGEATKDIVSKNPYQLAEDVFGVGFRTADKIALEMGFAPASSHRLRAALLYLLNQAQDEGHVFLPVEELFSRVWEALDLEEDSEWAELMEKQLKRLAQDGLLVLEGLPGGTAAYLAPLYHAERYAAHKLRELARYSFSEAPDPLASEEAIAGLSEGQRQAVLQALSHGLLVITGGPGTGKTTTTKSLLALFARQGLEVLLAAPTGRAAKRMTEATGREAKTIHRLLEYAYSEGEGYRFQRDEARPLRAHVLIVDEVSMVDVLLFCQLLKAIPAGCRLILVGDADQLPSVGPGNVLREIIASGSVPVARLEQIFRQAERSAIVTNAHLVNAGQLPQWEGSSGEFCFISQSEPEQILEQILDLCSRRLPRYRNKDAINDIQVLSPMRRTVLGVENLNSLGDKVMQIRNNYQKEVFNGDIGSITYLNLEDGELTVCYPDVSGLREVLYDLAELEELVLSYAVSVHKSQGSEYPVVILPVVTQHYVLLQRNLLYTAITRAKELVVLVGTRKALAIAVRNNKVETRYTRLAARLNG
ncbi:MAG: AAA family ATPase [Firmicutes bacterium]|nr:AAA family ATPase [Bacillota bacterium]